MLNSAYAKAVLNHSYKILLKDKLVQTAWINLRTVIFGSFMVYTMEALLAIHLASYVFGLRQGCPCLFWHGLPGSLGGVSVGVAGFWANWQLKSIKERLQDLLLATSLSLREAPRQSVGQDFKTRPYVETHPFCLRFHRKTIMTIAG